MQTIGYKVTIEIRNVLAVDDNIEALQKALDGKRLSAVDVVLLMDTMSILQGIKRNIESRNGCEEFCITLPSDKKNRQENDNGNT